jgi:glucoamylase
LNKKRYYCATNLDCAAVQRYKAILPALNAVMRLALLLSFFVSQTADAASLAPGGPGSPGTWAPAQKSILGTALSANSRVYFTGHEGTLSEIFYPTLDAVQSVNLQFFVADKGKTFVDEEQQQPYVATRPDPHSMRWQVVTTNPGHHWRITKEVLTDSRRSSLVVQTRFEALDGRALGDFNLFVFHDPSLDNSNAGDTSRTRGYRGRTLLVASQGTRASALALSRPWVLAGSRPRVSSGFVGVSDGRADLANNGAMDWTYEVAQEGNVAQLGCIDLDDKRKRKREKSVTFVVALGFGATEAEAMATATDTLRDDIRAIRHRYDDEWHAYANRLDNQGGLADEQYYLAAMTLKTIQDKSNGAMIAGMGTPWGESSGDGNPAGYHMVWSRDLFKFANALVTAGDVAAAARAVQYLFEVLQEKADCGAVEGNSPDCPQGYTRKGRFPQNAWVDGRQSWTATQMDEQAMPLALAWRVWDKGDAAVKRRIRGWWPTMRATADAIVAHGPWTQEERWEESSGYSPSTIAAEVAGLVAAAELARMDGDVARAGRYLAAADHWQQNVTTWTFTTSGPLGDHNYFIRLNPAKRRASGIGFDIFDPTAGPDDPTVLLIGNGAGPHDQRAIVDGGFLELVRYGVKSATDPAIVGSLSEYDSTLKQTIAGKGDGWFRYNYDGYGERNDGESYDGVSGRGRLWPIFTAERGMYEIARTGNGASGKPYLAALKAFSTPEGFIPEQVWTQPTNRPDWLVVTPSAHLPGTPTKSIAPLNWAMGEYISLLASIHAGAVIDLPRIVCRRYHTCTVPPAKGEIAIDVHATATVRAGQHVYITGDVDVLGNWNTDLGIPADATEYPVWKTVVLLPAGSPIHYKYYRKNPDGTVTWENTPDGGNREFIVPISGSGRWNDTIRW